MKQTSRNTKEESITRALLAWYAKGHRALPWREDPSPYHVWLSEIMLQQTRVEAVKPYYERFLRALPDIAALAACEETKLLKLWEGLGYYSRVRNLQKAARIITEELDGRMPEEVSALKRLPGIGDYTAGAIASIAFGKRAAAVDGNVLRVTARLCADASDIAKEETKRAVRERIEASFLPKEDAACGSFNQALMELGATVCLPNGSPLCTDCPLARYCEAHLAGTEAAYPVKSAKKARRMEERTVLLICDRERVALQKRPEKGLLAGLWEYPCLEKKATRQTVLRFLKQQGVSVLRVLPLPEAKHIFTHVEWKMTGFLVYADATGDYFMVNRREIESVYAIPSAYRSYTREIRALLPESVK
ncbi:MAG: A/G-specific adenine glycosylase [Lachnospiraceae bacterium]|nr:A/G-specific adenine glycosylase [Lachnospiraceae bacterium]